ncbi:growth hormone secretagogue receptor type 1 isoform X1 [Chamaea fasciata]|uniref:growth hormone secretagogue receptor type 1 isoform X1 n=1 Tax=Chamaea fasciata TaxID=190680 RepID=UPI00336A0115
MREGSAGGRGAENRTGAEPPLHLFPVPVLTGITVACVLLFVIGIIGNLMTMLVVSRFRDMRTTTNFYLSSMAFSDLLIFLCMPLDLFRLWQYRPWNFGDLLCKLFQFISESCTYSTILNITALSVERYVAICFPLRAKVIITKGKVKLVILFLWAVSFLSAGPIFILVGVEHENGTNPLSTNECRATEYAIRSGLLTIMVWTSSVFFFLPVFCLTVLYSLIGRKLWRRKRKNIGPNTAIRDKNNKQTVKMLAQPSTPSSTTSCRGSTAWPPAACSDSERRPGRASPAASRAAPAAGQSPASSHDTRAPSVTRRGSQKAKHGRGTGQRGRESQRWKLEVALQSSPAWAERGGAGSERPEGEKPRSLGL